MSGGGWNQREDCTNRDSFNNASLVTILAGQVPHQEKFMVHDWIIQRSEFFQRALDGQRAGVDKRVIELPIDGENDIQPRCNDQ